MKDRFPEFYKLTEDDINKLWDECYFVFDANVLLNLYRYTHKTSDKLLLTLEKISDRIWVPHQFALEYQRNRMSVIEEQKKKLESSIVNAKKELQNINSLLEYYPAVQDIDIENIEKQLDEALGSYPGCIDEDPIRNQLDKLFHSKIGHPYESDKIAKILEDGKDRYKKKTPPGYLDEKKDKEDPTGLNKYGDLIGWYQMIDKAKEDKKPIVFITGERKEDWWQVVKGNYIGPRHELLKEFIAKTNDQTFHMYEMNRFLDYAKPKYSIDDDAIAEVKKIDDTYFDKPLSEIELDAIFGTTSSDLSPEVVSGVDQKEEISIEEIDEIFGSSDVK